MNQTFTPTPKHIKRSWHIVDAQGQILGRLSSQIAQTLIGKDKPYFANHLDCGDYVVVINAKKIKTTGTKTSNKLYRRHSGYPGGFKETNLKDLLQKTPSRVIEFAVKGMLPKNKLRADRLGRLKVFSDDKHPYQDKLTTPEKA